MSPAEPLSPTRPQPASRPDLRAGRGPELDELQSACERRAELLVRRRRRLERARVAAFLAAPVCFFSPLWLPISFPVALLLTAVASVGFVAFAVRHDRLRERERRLAVLRSVAREAQARRPRRWADLPLLDAAPPPASHPYGGDLDLFGPRSLFHLLDAAGTPLGIDTLRRWILDPPPLKATLDRQAAVRELTPLLELRLKLAASGRLAGRLAPQGIAAFFRWAEGPPWLLLRPWLVWTSRLVPAATLLLAVLQAAGVVHRPWWAAPLVAGFVLAALTWRRASAIVRGAELGAGSVTHLAEAFRLIADASLDAPLLVEIQAHLAAGDGAPRQARRLAGLIQLGEIRYSDMLHGVLHGLLLWDVHVAYVLERWRRTSGPAVRRWFAALADTEALGCLAELADAHPGWAYPVIREAREPRVVAKNLAHPLLPPESAVANDVRLEPGRILFVTGSNMSGKSTLLRAIATNLILARLGAPVCATSLEATASALFTYFRVSDSLMDGVSSFLAGLRRLKELLDLADAADGGAGGVIFLLDEPLQGTNPPERQAATRRTLRSLLRPAVTGAIASHDLALAEPEDLRRVTVPVHFRERVDAQARELTLVFDYTLQPGVCTSTNALRLLDALGFPKDDR